MIKDLESMAYQTNKKNKRKNLVSVVHWRKGIKLQQRRIRLDIRNNILKVEHVTLKDSSTTVTGSFQEHTRHTTLRSNTGLTCSAMGQWREFAGFLMSL